MSFLINHKTEIRVYVRSSGSNIKENLCCKDFNLSLFEDYTCIYNISAQIGKMVYYCNMFLNFDHSHVIDMLLTHLVKFQKSAQVKFWQLMRSKSGDGGG